METASCSCARPLALERGDIVVYDPTPPPPIEDTEREEALPGDDAAP